MPLHPNLGYSVTKVEAPTLNNAGSSIENPIIRGACLELKLHKWHPDVRLRKAWVTVPSVKRGVFYDLTSLAIPSFTITTEGAWTGLSDTQKAEHLSLSRPDRDYVAADVTSIDYATAVHIYDYSAVDEKKYILFRFKVGSGVVDEETGFADYSHPNITQHGDPPVRNIFHLTTTNGKHTPMRDRHIKSEKGTDNATGLVLDQSSIDRPGGQQIKFSLWISQEIQSSIELDGYSPAVPSKPLIYPIYTTGEAGEQTVARKLDFTEPPRTS